MPNRHKASNGDIPAARALAQSGSLPPRPKQTPRPAGSHWSPLRYPGGKRPFLRIARAWLSGLHRTEHLVEGFAGGASVGLTALCEGYVDRLTLIELDADIAHFWATVFSSDGDELAKRIERTPTVAAAHALLGSAPVDDVDRALHTLIENRLGYNGIRVAGAGKLGTAAGAPASSWTYNPTTLAWRIRYLASRRAAVDVIHGDALAVLPSYARQPATGFYLDPPYSAEGTFAQRQYLHWQLNHPHLVDVAAGLSGEFLLSHQDAKLVRQLAGWYRLELAEVPMPRRGRGHVNELLISRDLSWLKRRHVSGGNLPGRVVNTGPMTVYDVNLNVLAAFVVTAEELNFTGAARRLGIAQPALSKRIRSLESKLDKPLLLRTRNSVSLTKVGESLYQRLRGPLAALDSALFAA
jgi:site-specific DNA-adenine methylase